MAWPTESVAQRLKRLRKDIDDHYAQMQTTRYQIEKLELDLKYKQITNVSMVNAAGDIVD